MDSTRRLLRDSDTSMPSSSGLGLKESFHPHSTVQSSQRVPFMFGTILKQSGMRQIMFSVIVSLTPHTGSATVLRHRQTCASARSYRLSTTRIIRRKNLIAAHSLLQASKTYQQTCRPSPRSRKRWSLLRRTTIQSLFRFGMVVWPISVSFLSLYPRTLILKKNN